MCRTCLWIVKKLYNLKKMCKGIINLKEKKKTTTQQHFIICCKFKLARREMLGAVVFASTLTSNEVRKTLLKNENYTSGNAHERHLWCK